MLHITLEIVKKKQVTILLIHLCINRECNWNPEAQTYEGKFMNSPVVSNNRMLI